jgi:hypothetical protein
LEKLLFGLWMPTFRFYSRYQNELILPSGSYCVSFGFVSFPQFAFC